MHAAVITHLRCPVCGAGLAPADRTLRCPTGHSFDVARQGYVDLTAGQVVHTGDTADMVAARDKLLHGGHFDPVAVAVAAAVSQVPATGLILEVGAGTAWYLSRTLEPDRTGLAVDVSKPALRRAARAHPRIGAVRADVWQGLPVHDETADALLDIFAPRSGVEFARVLKPGAPLVVVTPAPGHLAQLVAAMGMIGVDPAKRDRLARSLDPWFEPASAEPLTADLRLTRADAAALIGMGPSAWHVDLAKVADLAEPVEATLSVEVSVWHRRSGG